MRHPSPEQKAKEKAVLYTSMADLAIVIPMFGIGMATLSLTLLSEAIRVALMLVVEVYTLIILRAAHRDQLRQFRFGTYKLEQFCSFIIGAALVASGAWICNRVATTVLTGELVATPMGLAMAAIISAINTTINALGWYSMAMAAERENSPIYEGQLRARKIKFMTSLVVQTTITIAALAHDPLVSLWFDGVGGAFVAFLQVTIGVRMISEALPDLLDHSVPDDFKARIAYGVRLSGVQQNQVLNVRTRRAGPRPQVELTVNPDGCDCLDDLRRRKQALRQSLQDGDDDMDLSVLVDLPRR